MSKFQSKIQTPKQQNIVRTVSYIKKFNAKQFEKTFLVFEAIFFFVTDLKVSMNFLPQLKTLWSLMTFISNFHPHRKTKRWLIFSCQIHQNIPFKCWSLKRGIFQFGFTVWTHLENSWPLGLVSDLELPNYERTPLPCHLLSYLSLNCCL